MRVLIYGHKRQQAFEIFSATINHPNYQIIGHQKSNPTLDVLSDFNAKMLEFASSCSQSYIPGIINIYQETPWSLHRKWSLSLNSIELKVITTYYGLVGWKPDVLIYCYNQQDEYSQEIEYCCDPDNADGVKVFKVQFNDKLECNFKLILDTILTHYPTDKLVNHNSS